MEKALEWILPSEQLPQIGERVLITRTTEDGKKVDISYFDKYGFLCGIVDAWMPLPEPYKVEK